MGNNKSLVDLRCSINSNCMRVYPYGVDRAYSAQTKVECTLNEYHIPYEWYV